MVADHDSLRCLRGHTSVSRLEKDVPKPAGGVPEFGLPLWYDIPLDQPLPILLPPQPSVIFTRGKMGRKLRKCKSVEERQFLLTDPLLRNTPSLEYEPLHDKDMREYFSRKRVRAHLKKAGLITADGDVLCSFQQFARYRRYLGSLHRLAVAAELRRREEANTAARLLNAARTKWAKAANDMVPACIDGLDMIYDEECCIRKCRDCECPCLQKTGQVAEVTPRPWRTLPWKKLKSGRRQHKVTRRWLDKSLLQLQTKYCNEELLRKDEIETRERVAALRMAYKKHWDIMHDKLRRAKRTRENLRSQQFEDRLKRMSMAFHKAWQEQTKTEADKNMQPGALLLQTTAPEKDSFYALLETKQKLLNYKEQPEAVTSVVNELLDTTVTSYTIAEVIKMVEEVLERLTQRVSKVIDSTSVSNRLSSIFVGELRKHSASPPPVAPRLTYIPSIEENTPSMFATLAPTPSIDEDAAERRQSSVRFQMPSESEIRKSTPQDPIKTMQVPMPSVTQLVEAVFEEDILELPRRKVPFSEKGKLRRSLRSLASFLKDSVMHAPAHKIKATKMRVIQQDYSSRVVQDECIEKVSIQLAAVITTHNLQEVLESKEIQDVIDCLLHKIIKAVLRDQNDRKHGHL